MQLIAPSLSVKQRLNVNVSPGERTNRGSSGAFLISRLRSDDMAVGTELADRQAPPAPGFTMARSPKVAVDRLQVVAARAMASLAADRLVGGRRADRLRRRVSEVTIERDVAVQTPHDSVAHLNRLASDIFARVRAGHIAGSGSPRNPSAGVIRRKSQCSISSFVVPADHRHVLVARSEGILDDRDR